MLSVLSCGDCLDKLLGVNILPKLTVVTRELPERVDLVSYADPENPMLWMRDSRGCVGFGEVLRLHATGVDRSAQLINQWRQVASAATVDDAVQLPGSGLISFGTIAFADDSAQESVLIVPRTLVHRHDDTWFLTEISTDAALDDPSRTEFLRTATAEHRPRLLPDVAPVTQWPGVTIDPVLSPERAEEYRQAVATLTERIDRGEAEKVVLARPVSAPLPEATDLRVPLGRLAERYVNCWTFAIDGMLGATPETLIRQIGETATALVLAGTAPRHLDDPVADDASRRFLETATHIDEEHRFAAESVIDTLAPLVADLETSTEPLVIRLPNVWHRATKLAAHTHPGTFSLELVAAMHPTAAIAGTPTNVAIDMIRELEPVDRGRYSGAVGWIDAAGNGEWAIALRCAQIRPGTLTAWAGGGIVSGSDPETELEETLSKFQPIVEAFE